MLQSAIFVDETFSRGKFRAFCLQFGNFPSQTKETKDISDRSFPSLERRIGLKSDSRIAVAKGRTNLGSKDYAIYLRRRILVSIPVFISFSQCFSDVRGSKGIIEGASRRVQSKTKLTLPGFIFGVRHTLWTNI